MTENSDAGAKQYRVDIETEPHASIPRTDFMPPIVEQVAALHARISALEDRLAELERRERNDRRP